MCASGLTTKDVKDRGKQKRKSWKAEATNASGI